MPVTLTQTVVGAGEFTGLGSSGFFSFQSHWRLPRTTGVIIHTLSYVEITAGPALTTEVQFFAIKSLGGAPTIKVPLGDATTVIGLLDASGNARLKLCGHVLERNPGAFRDILQEPGMFWDVVCFTKNKTHTATVTLTFDLCDFEESGLRGSREI